MFLSQSLLITLQNHNSHCYKTETKLNLQNFLQRFPEVRTEDVEEDRIDGGHQYDARDSIPGYRLALLYIITSAM